MRPSERADDEVGPRDGHERAERKQVAERLKVITEEGKREEGREEQPRPGGGAVLAPTQHLPEAGGRAKKERNAELIRLNRGPPVRRRDFRKYSYNPVWIRRALTIS